MKITPINITLACALTWIISEWSNEQFDFSWWFVSFLIVFLVVVDIIFRMMFKQTQKLWMAEIGFIVVTCVLLLIIKIV
ncbi:hypothetical protein HP439_18475 [Sphingobacterium shayense]|uniref:hypothetical protein n=1 Tax=Sphingobacterium shayense TaxID=626343 RepID=UPI001552079A|nr:hypothetical protein [Sphingobacterium shayense]NQD72713.1 hypothetical protein [Sphingobacterium shayense]